MKSKVNIAEAAKLIRAGWTLRQVGRKYGVSGERVRQVLGECQRSCLACGGLILGRHRTCDACKKAARLCVACGQGQTTAPGHRCRSCANKHMADVKRVFDYGEVLDLYCHKLKAREIAERLGTTAGSVYQIVRRARQERGVPEKIRREEVAAFISQRKECGHV